MDLGFGDESLVCLFIYLFFSQENDKEAVPTRESWAETPVPSLLESPIPEVANTDSNLETMSVSSDLPNLPQSLQFMHTAHEHLGR